MCKEDHVWNPRTCACECECDKDCEIEDFLKKKYTCVKIPIGDSVITYDQVIDTPS